MLQIITIGLALGAGGSLHCIGMCGPLSMMLPTQHFSSLGKFIALLLYQVGRVITYVMVSLLFSLLGRTIFNAGYQEAFSITAGIFLFVIAMTVIFHHRIARVRRLNLFYSQVARLIGRLLVHARQPAGFLFVGMANGLLPCGMVYVALMTTIAFGNILQGSLFMASFGLGTLPAMLLFAYVGKSFGLAARPVFRRLPTYMMLIVSMLLVLRGLNLDIPYISPSISSIRMVGKACQP